MAETTSGNMIEVIRNAVPAPLALACYASWPHLSDPRWYVYNDSRQFKFATRDQHGLTDAARLCLHHLAGRLTRSDCFPDLTFHGAGMHMIPRSGFVRRHLDADCHPICSWTRRYSVILFINPEWDAGWGGALQFDEKVIVPEFNTAVVFENTDDAWHEVTTVHVDSRMTLAMYLWQLSSGGRKRPRALFQDYPWPSNF